METLLKLMNIIPLIAAAFVFYYFKIMVPVDREQDGKGSIDF